MKNKNDLTLIMNLRLSKSVCSNQKLKPSSKTKLLINSKYERSIQNIALPLCITCKLRLNTLNWHNMWTPVLLNNFLIIFFFCLFLVEDFHRHMLISVYCDKLVFARFCSCSSTAARVLVCCCIQSIFFFIIDIFFSEFLEIRLQYCFI